MERPTRGTTRAGWKQALDGMCVLVLFTAACGGPRAPAPEPAVEASQATVGALLVDSPNVYGDVWVGPTSYGPPPVLIENLPAGVAVVQIRVGGQVRRSVSATVVAAATTRVTIP